MGFLMTVEKHIKNTLHPAVGPGVISVPGENVVNTLLIVPIKQ